MSRWRSIASGPDVSVTARVTGDVPGSPVDLRYRFRLQGAAIARLEIAPNPKKLLSAVNPAGGRVLT